MSATTKSPRKVLVVAYTIGQRALRPYAHRFSPRKFTQPQLFACLVLKEFFKADYRGIEGILNDSPDLCRAIGLEKVPHFTTLQKAAKRLLCAPLVRHLLDATVTPTTFRGPRRRRVPLAAIDGTGFETRHISPYFVQRRKRCQPGYQTTTYTRFPKAGLVCDCAGHLILAVVPGRGPGPDDPHYQPALREAVSRARIGTLLADPGYDSEAAHEFARNVCGVRTLIPPTRGRPTAKRPRGRWRRVMSTRFDRAKYGQRWQVETVVSMLKRLLGSALRARRYWSQCREIVLRILTLNVMILHCLPGLFYGAILTPFFSRSPACRRTRRSAAAARFPTIPAAASRRNPRW